MREETAPENTANAAVVFPRFPPHLAQRAKDALERTLAFLHSNETVFFVVLAVLIGLSTGVFTYVFDALIHRIFVMGLRGDANELTALSLIGRWRILIFPALGGLVVGPLIHYLSPESKGEGVPQVMKAMHSQGGRLRGRIAVLKAVCSAISIGTGGSAGREGPIVQIGASIGSRLAQVFRVSAVTLKTMAAAGSAAGIAAAFNAPLGGMAFSIEVILGEITTGPFALVVISSVVAAVVSRGLHGPTILFKVPPYRLLFWEELLLYALLGFFAGVTAKVFQRVFYRVEEEFEQRCSASPAWRAGLGGFLVGAMGFFVPGILGPGYEVIWRVLEGGYAPIVLLLLLAGKMFATSLTLGSGGSGGTLMPALFMGAALGSILGQAFQALFPGIAAPGAYAMVGMAAFFAALVNAPLTGILIMFELTNDYAMIAPLMMAVVLAVIVARFIEDESIYTEKLARIGIQYHPEPETALLIRTPVAEIMTKKVRTLRAGFPVGQLGRFINKTKLTGFPVVDEEDLLVGMVTHAEAQAAYAADPPPSADAPVGSIMRTVGALKPSDTASEALHRMFRLEIDRLPVAAPEEPRRLLGIVSQKDLMDLYARRIGRMKGNGNVWGRR